MSAELIGANNRRRNKIFDKAVESTLYALRHPEVINELGQERVDSLVVVVHGLIRPNVRHGVATIPVGLVDTDRFPFLPVIEEDAADGLLLGDTLLTPTRRRRLELGKRVAEKRAIDQGTAQEEVDELIRYRLEKQADTIRAHPLDGRRARTQVTSVPEPSIGLEYLSRPVLMLDAVNAENDDVFNVAGAVAHEATHGLDYEDIVTLPEIDDPFRVYTELRAYHPGAVIRRVGGVLEADSTTAKVEQLRQRHATPDNPYPQTPQLIADFQALKASNE